ncbi:MAG: Rho termination factor N-terminal domain-containing protein, partial [Bacteroidales bacterium]|nr:Rho termination factor N-terminal domain-containing protein [Bacteroidales bacterium]
MQDDKDLSKMLLPDLKNLATSLGIKGVSTLRKPQVIELIEEKRRKESAKDNKENTDQSKLKRPRFPADEKHVKNDRRHEQPRQPVRNEIPVKNESKPVDKNIPLKNAPEQSDRNKMVLPPTSKTNEKFVSRNKNDDRSNRHVQNLDEQQKTRIHSQKKYPQNSPQQNNTQQNNAQQNNVQQNNVQQNNVQQNNVQQNNQQQN